jgi:autotransporter-associated beta strand protein
MGNGNDSGEWVMDEWITFKGSNYVSVGTLNTDTGNTADAAGGTEISAPVLNPSNRVINLGGVLTLEGTTTFDVVSGQTFRVGWNGSGAGYLTGSGDIIKDGQGTMEIRTNNPDYTGNLTVLQGRLMSLGQADPSGLGYLTGKIITIGSNSRQGTAEFAINSESGNHNQTTELNHDINVVYNPSQTKRLTFETFGNGARIDVNSDITFNDNLNIYINDGAENGGSQNYVNLNGVLKDGTTTSGNLILHGDDAGNANDNTSGRPYNYLVMKSDSSLWTGDVRVNANTGYDQDQNTILRLEHNNALTAANDVDMGFNSILQAGGGSRTIGTLSTNGGVGPFIGGTAGGTMGASANGTTVVIENAAATAGTLTITQTTPVQVEAQWNAHFRDGTLNSQFFAPGAGPTASAALNVVKAGNGWATMTVDNAYTGSTTVTGGILQVGRNGVGDTGTKTTQPLGAAQFTSNAGTTVAGTGSIQGLTVINGNLRPGDEAGGSMGTLTINGNATLGSTANTFLQVQRSTYTAFNALGYGDANYASWIGGLTSDPTYSHMLNDPVTTSQHDRLTINGTLTAGGKITLLNNGYNPAHGDVFKLIDWTTLSGTFSVGGTLLNTGLFRTGAETGLDLDLFELGSGFRWDVSLFNTQGIVVVVVPEPGRALLLLLGLMALFFRRRRHTAL